MRKDYGGIALEYVLVSTFAAVVTAVLLGFAANTAQTQIKKLADRYNLPIKDLELIKILGE